ncbi:MAG: hypothetical protein M1818_005732 [Claussenomyces sp. TS43310]|nr:MAG: hypothetical protein M1818_005732 [Claussenomyces sp. TS43310]
MRVRLLITTSLSLCTDPAVWILVSIFSLLHFPHLATAICYSKDFEEVQVAGSNSSACGSDSVAPGADVGLQDVEYNSITEEWSCCAYANGTVNCAQPRLDTAFYAIAPNQFPGTVTSASSTFLTSTSAATSASIPTPITSSTTSTGVQTPSRTSISHSSGLSTGADAGIGIGAAVAVIASLGLFYIWWRRRNHNRGEPVPSGPDVSSTPPFSPPSNDYDAHEMKNVKVVYSGDGSAFGRVPVEVDATDAHRTPPAELYGGAIGTAVMPHGDVPRPSVQHYGSETRRYSGLGM